MATEAQVIANRQNAAHATGPRSPEGKAKSARNALRHGLTTEQIVLPHENPENFEEFAAELRVSLAPVGAFEELLVERIVVNSWRLRRAAAFEAAIYARANQERTIAKLKDDAHRCSPHSVILHQDDPPSSKEHLKAKANVDEATRKLEAQPLFGATRVLDDYERQLENLARHEERLQNTVFKLLHELQRLQLERAGEPVPAPAALDVNVSVKAEPIPGDAAEAAPAVVAVEAAQSVSASQDSAPPSKKE